MKNIFRRPEKKRKVSEYPSGHLHSLPLELVLQILECLDNKSLVSLSLTCFKINRIVNQYHIYKDAVFRDSSMFLKYCGAHMASSSLSRRFSSRRGCKVAYLTKLHLVNPPAQIHDNHSTKIGGSYGVESKNSLRASTLYTEYQDSLNGLLVEAESLQDVVISEISPTFEFGPPVKARSARSLRSLELSAQSGWSLPFKTSHLTPFLAKFARIEKLILRNFIIDSDRLAKNANISNTAIPALCLYSCTYLRKPMKHCPLFANVEHLQLRDILSEGDLSLIDFVKHNSGLHALTLDLSSAIFYQCSFSKKSFNFAKFNSLFRLLCSQKGSWKSLHSLTLLGFDYGAFNSAADREREAWHEPSHLEELLMYISNVPLLDIELGGEGFPEGLLSGRYRIWRDGKVVSEKKT